MIDERLKCLLFLLFMYAFHLLPQNGILSDFFYLQNIIILLNKDLFLPFFGLQDSLSWSSYLEMFI